MSAAAIRTRVQKVSDSLRAGGAGDNGHDAGALAKENGISSAAEPRAPEAFPTIIVASKDGRQRGWFLRGLAQGAAPLVLEADGEAAVLDFIKLHSRPIHVLLIDFTLDHPGFVETVRKYRREMQVVLVTGDREHGVPGALSPDTALARARELLAR